jgi:hypothetical protein
MASSRVTPRDPELDRLIGPTFTSPDGSSKCTVRFARSSAANIAVRASRRRDGQPGSVIVDYQAPDGLDDPVRCDVALNVVYPGRGLAGWRGGRLTSLNA